MSGFTDAMRRFHFQLYSLYSCPYVHRPITYELKIKLIKICYTKWNKIKISLMLCFCSHFNKLCVICKQRK